MRDLSGNQIREEFLRFFEGKCSAAGACHRRVHSSSLVPANDPTLLFTNAGMNQFKDVFLGAEARAYTRAASSQKCVRAGGKHNDLENVGFTRRHHTFFEMLGNFSFGDYFKKEAIAYAWELLTSPEWFGIDPARLYVTIFEGMGEGDANVPRDNEAEQFWIETGVPRERIFAMGAKDNFWAMGETGPCGPCSEIFYDLGLAASEVEGVDEPFPRDEQRYMEIWNLVFMQFDRAADGTLTPLPKPSIDTGMGLERIACVLQGKLSNYDSDLFTPLLAAAIKLTDAQQSPEDQQFNLDSRYLLQRFSTLLPWVKFAVSDEKGAASLRIIADHARAATFLISDGVIPANEGRGYVLRRILRRSIVHGRLLGQNQPFMQMMVFAVRDEMQAAYPELRESAEHIAQVVLQEELQYARTIDSAATKYEEVMTAAKLDFLRRLVADSSLSVHFRGVHEQQFIAMPLGGGYRSFHEDLAAIHSNQLDPESTRILYQMVLSQMPLHLSQRAEVSGREAFRILETFGLPLDFMVDTARDSFVDFDMDGFERARQREQERARASWKGGSQKTAAPVYRELAKTEFEGYGALRVDGARVLALIKDGVGVNELRAGDAGEVVLDATSFYADSGGQVGDVGWLYAADHNTVMAEVSGCRKPVQGVFAHQVVAKQVIAVGAAMDTQVNGEVRAATMRNHTGTHLLHAALREVLGKHVKQAGSLVDRQRLRFDFSHFTGVADEELQEIEDIVNRQVLANTPVQTMVDVPIDEAVHELGAMALFGEKYGELVRVVKIGDFSTELCGGTHTAATGEIGLLKLVGESAVASGTRRVEAVTGTGSLAAFRRDADVAKVAAQFAGAGDVSPAAALGAKLAHAEDEMRKLRRELEQMRMKSASAATADAAASAVEVKGVKVLAQRVDALGESPQAKSQMRNLVDELRGKLGSGVVVLGAATADGKVSLIAGVTKDLTGRIQAGKLVGALATKVGGKGGGRPDLAEAGGSDVAGLAAALEAVPQLVGEMLG